MKNLTHRLYRGIDTAFEALSVICLATTVVIVLWQVFSRELLTNTPSWSEESARILLIWLSFLGATIAFRERAHIAITLVVGRFPRAAQTAIHRAVQVLQVGFGLFLVVQGIRFVRLGWDASLPGTGLPRSAMYLIMPIAGAMLMAYTVLQAQGVDTQRYTDTTETAKPIAPADAD